MLSDAYSARKLLLLRERHDKTILAIGPDGFPDALTPWAGPGFAQAPERLSDKDVKAQLQERFNADYSASTEVATVLKQSTQINTFMLGSSSAMKGRSEWERQVLNLKRLAELYRTTSPLPDGAAVRRMNDKDGRRGRIRRHGGGSVQGRPGQSEHPPET